MPATVIVAGIFLTRPDVGGPDVEGEQDGKPEEAQAEQGQQGEPTQPQGRQAQQVEKPDYEPLLDRQDARIRELESQVAEAAKSREAVDKLAAEIERLRAEAAEERTGYELRLAGARNVTAARALLAEHGGDVAELKGAKPWLFASEPPAGGTTGLEPAGTAAKAEQQTMSR